LLLTEEIIENAIVLTKGSEHKSKIKRSDVRVEARKALSKLLQPLAGFVFDTGLSAHEFQTLYRTATVISAADRQRDSTGRLSISGIAASTGIPRAEISRILKLTSRVQQSDRQQQATNRILSAWHENPKYTNTSGLPADLSIFGPGPTFDSLVRAHGRGIPTRAMLDELTRTDSVEVLSSRKVRAKALVAVDHGVGTRAIKAFGDRATELLWTMLANIRNPERFRFVSNVEGVIESASTLPLFRKEISTRGQNFLAGIRETLFREPINELPAAGERKSVRVSVTVYYREAEQQKQLRDRRAQTRRNFRRSVEQE